MSYCNLSLNINERYPLIDTKNKQKMEEKKMSKSIKKTNRILVVVIAHLVFLAIGFGSAWYTDKAEGVLALTIAFVLGFALAVIVYKAVKMNWLDFLYYFGIASMILATVLGIVLYSRISPLMVLSAFLPISGYIQTRVLLEGYDTQEGESQ